ncbi:DNA/RNA helicase domain-containing protein [Streptomyces sp. NPDC096032]|uniref:DNA/RNA helicase domain-containing protein n=1 Tax=Streptomyces sp. NPDC096032 TaxID=3366070 RepID=UPI00380179CF
MLPPAHVTSCCPGDVFVSLLRMSAKAVVQAAGAGSLVESLATQFRFTYGYEAGVSEQRSWGNSLPALAHALVDAGLEDVEVLLEYPVPLSSYRVDALLAGAHPTTGDPAYVVVELKQWTAATPVPDAEDLVTVPGTGNTARLHPVAQVRRYCDHIVDFTRSLHGHEHRVSGAAFLHNATDFDVDSLFDLPTDEYGQLFTASSRGAFQEFLKQRLAPLSGARAADALHPEQIAPSKKLMSVAAEEIQQRSQFNLLNEQQVAYSLVMRAVKKARQSDFKEVIVVTGGPGSGKSVIALELLGELYRNNLTAVHATGSKSFTTTLQKVAGRGSTRVQKLFRYFNNFTHVEKNGLDVLLCDESHRIRESSNHRFTPKNKRSNRRQIEELLDAARVPVFLLDEHQVVRPGEMGTVHEIDAAAKAKGLTVRHVSLDGQFRCGGSRAYEEWVLRLLGLTPGGPIPWQGDGLFSVTVAETPQELEAMLRTHQAKGLQARMTAGFCWPWSEPFFDDDKSFVHLVDDVNLPQWDWKRPWNVQGDRSVGGYPSKNLWATDPAGFTQVGCIYTAQGFEYDYSGVIFGPDLVWRDGVWVADRKSSKDTVVARAPEHEFAHLIRNTYKVLLTRGMQGTVLFSTDTETREMLRSLVRPA